MRMFYLFISMIIGAVLYNLLLLPLNLVPGGTSGIATITYYVYEIDPALMIFLISAACCILSFLYLGVERTLGTLVGCVAYPLMVKLTSHIGTAFPIDTTDILLLVLFAGVLAGVSNGLMYKSGYSTGGLPIISQILFEKFHIAIAKTSLVMNIVIVSIGAAFFGITNALYAVIYLYINSIVIDRVLLGISMNKAFYIITKEEKEVKEYMINHLKHTVTTFDVKGGFLENKKKVILTVVPSREYYRVTEGIRAIDPEVFFVATDAYQVSGAK